MDSCKSTKIAAGKCVSIAVLRGPFSLIIGIYVQLMTNPIWIFHKGYSICRNQVDLVAA